MLNELKIPAPKFKSSSLNKVQNLRHFHRQFTPDLLPSDVTGSENIHEENGEYKFSFEEGPIFGNVILADETNRVP